MAEPGHGCGQVCPTHGIDAGRVLRRPGRGASGCDPLGPPRSGRADLDRTGPQGFPTVVSLPSLHPGLASSRAFGTETPDLRTHFDATGEPW
jgi:hypothetical protein